MANEIKQEPEKRHELVVRCRNCGTRNVLNLTRDYFIDIFDEQYWHGEPISFDCCKCGKPHNLTMLLWEPDDAMWQVEQLWWRYNSAKR